MNIVQSGSDYYVYGEDVKTYKRLPAKAYRVVFSMNSGFRLVEHEDLFVGEKIYGKYRTKVSKVMKSFETINRNMGVILSGPKGSGKSVFARLLAIEGQKKGLPLIIVNNDVKGIENFIESIHQECIVLFDEFEKTFAKKKDDDRTDPQENLLSLFDGIDNGKKLYVITCNDDRKLSPYLRNRPGRFHYKFMIAPPEDDEIREYMNDNLVDPSEKVVSKIVALSHTAVFTYDVLRAIAFELNQGYSLEETAGDLNIERERRIELQGVIKFRNGERWYSRNPISYDTISSGIYTMTLKVPSDKVPSDVRLLLEKKDIEPQIYVDSDNLKPDREGYRLELSNDIIDWYGNYCDEDDLNASQKKALEEFTKNYVPEKVTLFRQDRSSMYQDELRIAI